MKKECKIYSLETLDLNPVTVPFVDCSIGKTKKLHIHHAGGQFRRMIKLGGVPKHLYITDDSKIGEGDWFINETNSYIGLGLCQVTSSREGSSKLKTPKSDSHFVAGSIKYLQKEDGFRKIIASTDKKLWKMSDKTNRKIDNAFKQHNPYPILDKSELRSVYGIHQDFIKQYCENPCESVMVEYVNSRTKDSRELEWDEDGLADEWVLKLKDKCIIISPIEEKMYSREEVISLIRKFSEYADDQIDHQGINSACCSIGSCDWDEDKWIEENL